MTSHIEGDVVLFGIPLIALLVFGFFRLDQVYTSGKRAQRNQGRPGSGPQRHGRSMTSDPDGRPWEDEPAPGKAQQPTR